MTRGTVSAQQRRALEEELIAAKVGSLRNDVPDIVFIVRKPILSIMREDIPEKSPFSERRLQ